MIASVEPSTSRSLVTWSSSNDEVATVSNSGYVQGVSAGTATITASIPGASDTCEVTVIAAEQTNNGGE